MEFQEQSLSASLEYHQMERSAVGGEKTKEETKNDEPLELRAGEEHHDELHGRLPTHGEGYEHLRQEQA